MSQGGDIRRIVHGADAPLIEAYIQEFLDSSMQPLGYLLWLLGYDLLLLLRLLAYSVDDLGVNISPADNFKYTLRRKFNMCFWLPIQYSLTYVLFWLETFLVCFFNRVV